MRFLVHNIIRHHIRLLQLENYDLSRFLSVVQKRYFPKWSNRDDVTWTMKLTLVVAVAFFLQAGTAWGLSLLPVLSSVVGVVKAVILFILLGYVFFIFVSLATLLLRPFDRLLRRFIVKRAKRKMKQLDELVVVGITGSYGKTTMKETVGTILGEAKRVVTTKENKNTPLGIARTIQKEVNASTDVFVVEMGAYTRGDIKALCNIAQPEISILTGINEAHLERFGSIENTVATKFEIVEYAAPDATIILNADDKRVMENFKEYVSNSHTVKYYSAQNDDRCEYRAVERTFYQDGSGISFELIRDSEKVGYFKVPFLAEYIIGNIIAAFLTGEVVGVAPSEVRAAVGRLAPAEHRLEPTVSRKGVVVIDDSYNGNPDGARAAIETLNKFTDRRKIYVTPGLVEVGDRVEAVHREIGARLANVADVVVLIDTSAAEYIKEGIEESEFIGEAVVTVDSMDEARTYLSSALQKGDVVIFQNDWPQNYI